MISEYHNNSSCKKTTIHTHLLSESISIFDTLCKLCSYARARRISSVVHAVSGVFVKFSNSLSSGIPLALLVPASQSLVNPTGLNNRTNFRLIKF